MSKLRSETSIKTERLWLRQIDETDAENIVSLRSDENVYNYFLNPHKLIMDEHRAWYNNTYIKSDDRIDWIAVDDETGAFVGVYGVKRESDDAVEISYITVESMKHKGYASEAVNSIMQWCAEKWGNRNYAVRIHRDNIPSIEFARRLGFVSNNSDSGKFIRMNKPKRGR